MPKEMLTLYTKLFVNRGNGDENLIDLLSTPDLGIGDPEKVEVTNLQDGTRRYINGLKDVGDSLEFEFNYTTDGYEKLKEIEESKEIYIYKVVLPDELCFEFEAALSTKITGAAVGEQIKMTINLTPYSAIKVGQYGENGGGTAQVNEYSTFRIGQSRARSAGTLKLYGNSEQPIEELYINNVAQELPTGVINDWNDTVVTNYEVNPGDIIKIKGGFSLWETELQINNISLQSDLTSCEGMFSECANLIEAVEIPEGVENCKSMYEGTSITIAPTIPEGVTNTSWMFSECAGLIEAPVIPTTVTNCEGMFNYTSITVAPTIPEGVTNTSWMFCGCESLEEAPVIPNSVTNCSGMFEDCTNLSVIPQENIDLMNNPPEGLNFKGCFTGCTQIADQVPVEWGGNKVEEPELVNEYTTFIIKDDDNITISIEGVAEPAITELYIDGEEQELPEFEREYEVEEGQEVKIKGHFKLRDANITNIKLQSNLIDCNRMFEGCRDLLIAPEIPEGVTNCERMFSGCSNLLTAPIIPSTVTNCNCMFEGCENLEKLPQENINLMYNHPEELNYEGCYNNCRMIRDIVLEDWGGERSQEEEMPEEFGEYEYTTFIMKRGGNITISIRGVAEPAVTELYINDEQQELPSRETEYEVEEGQEVKIKGHFKLKDANIARVKLQSNLTNCDGMFDCCELLIAPEIPEGVTNCESMFNSCFDLLTAPIIPSTVTNCSSMFMFCSSLEKLPPENIDLMNNHSDELQHDSCYFNCTKIIDPISYDEIPDDWK